MGPRIKLYHDYFSTSLWFEWATKTGCWDAGISLTWKVWKMTWKAYLKIYVFNKHGYYWRRALIALGPLEIFMPQYEMDPQDDLWDHYE
jgi:hypothetical protein